MDQKVQKKNQNLSEIRKNEANLGLKSYLSQHS